MLVITPNPAIDHTVHLAALRPGEVSRAHDGVSVAGGKGGNVTRAAGLLGVRATVLALVPAQDRAHLESLYAAEGFDLVSVPMSGRVRTCTALIEDDGRVTLVNEPGAAVDDGTWGDLMAAASRWSATASTHHDAEFADDHAAFAHDDEPVRGSAAAVSPRQPGREFAGRREVVVCSGSLPPGAPIDGYAQLVRAGHAAGLPVLVDASGSALLAAIEAGADLVCPNVSEAEAALAGHHAARNSGAGPSSENPSPAPVGSELVDDDSDDVPDRAAAAAHALVDLGARWAVVTAGSSGAAVAGPGYQKWLAAPAVTVRNPIGAGDSFMAGLATTYLAGRSWPAAIRRGLAAGSASVEQPAAGVLDPARVDELERQLQED